MFYLYIDTLINDSTLKSFTFQNLHIEVVFEILPLPYK
jgi:hypothetical protein